MLISSSKDLLKWEDAAFIELSDMHPDGGWGEKVTLDYIEDNDGTYRMIVSGNFFHGSKAYLGTSTNARDWQIEQAAFDGHSHPSLIHANDGRFLLMLSTGTDPTISEYPIHYASQMSSGNWQSWGSPTSLPRIHYLADYFMKPSTIFQDREGFYWIANHRHWGDQFQLYRVSTFPATTIPETFPQKPDAHRYARVQLRREELEHKARLEGNKELASCLSQAMHYQSCLDEQSVSTEREWWQFW